MTQATPSFKVVWRPMAEQDLDGIIDYIAQDSPSRAEEFGQMLRDKTSHLARHPRLGRSGRPSQDEFLRELVVHRNYIVFYRVRDEPRVVEILRVRHAAQMNLQ